MICARIETITCTYKGAHLLASHTFLHISCVFIYIYLFIYLFVYLFVYFLFMIVTCTKWKGGQQTYLGPCKRTLFSESLGVATPYFNRSIEVRSAWCGPAAALNVLRPWLETDYKRIARLFIIFTEIPWRTTEKKQPSIGLLPCAGAASVRKVLHEYVVPWLNALLKYNTLV